MQVQLNEYVLGCAGHNILLSLLLNTNFAMGFAGSVVSEQPNMPADERQNYVKGLKELLDTMADMAMLQVRGLAITCLLRNVVFRS